MLLLDRQSDATRDERAGSARIRLRLRADGRLLDLLSGKTTIGSSPRCNVRIQELGVQPLHCLVVQSDDGLRVRSWASDSKLNGESFVEAGLAVGDCLTLGSVDIEVVDPAVAAD